jgi:hypothetical protein
MEILASVKPGQISALRPVVSEQDFCFRYERG